MKKSLINGKENSIWGKQYLYLIVSNRDHIWFLVLQAANVYCVGYSMPWQCLLPSLSTAIIFCQLGNGSCLRLSS